MPDRDSPPLDEVAAFITKYIVVGPAAADFLALWCQHTWSFEAALTTPYPRVVSAERESGKSRTLEVLSLLARRGWLAIAPSAAVVYRKGDAEAPTLLLDEIDQVSFRDKMDLLSVLNSGYRVGIKVPRCDDKGNILEFDVFYPKAFAGLDDGKLPDTLRSRSVPVRLKRRRQDEPIARFSYRHAEPEAEKLTQRMAEWATANLEELADAEPDLPGELGDREWEIWEPLAAIADLAGGDWPKRARRAAKALAREKGETDESRGVKLLEDLRTVFAKKGDPDAIFTSDILEALNGLEESGWGGWNDGKGMLARDLKHQLARYPITPQKLRIGGLTRQGFNRRQFEDPWSRYLPNAGARSGGNRTNPIPEPDVLFPGGSAPATDPEEGL